MNLFGFYKDVLHLQVETAHNVWTTLEPYWAELPTRVERQQLDQEMFQKQETEGLSRASFPEPLDILKKYRVCLSEHDEDDPNDWHVCHSVLLVYAKSNSFVHSVVWF